MSFMCILRDNISLKSSQAVLTPISCMQKINLFFEFQKIKKKISSKISDFHQIPERNRKEALLRSIFIFGKSVIHHRDHNGKGME